MNSSQRRNLFVTACAIYLIFNSAFSHAAGVVQIPKTGQTVSYTAGDDGAQQKGLVWPSLRFMDNGDQTMTDMLTNLIWTKDGNSPGPAACAFSKTWYGALMYVKCLNSNSYLGKSDWRLPNSAELMSLVNYGKSNTAGWLNAQGFSNVQANYYWSSSTVASSTNTAWSVDLLYGILYNYNKDNFNYVWPVRGEQWSLDSLIIYGVFNLGNQNVGKTSALKTVTLENEGASLQASITLTGTNPEQFTIAPGGAIPCSSLSPTLAVGEKCTLNLGFSPTSSGSKTANLTIAANSKTQDIPVTGTGVTTITGKVSDLSTGQPLAAATVTITGGATTQTDPSGNYIFNSQPAYGVYNVTFSKTGYGTATVSGVVVSDTKNVTVNIGMTPPGPLNITSTSPLFHAETGIAYNQPIKITGGTGPYTFAVDTGTTLPPGLSIDPTWGNISGTPTYAGTYTLGITVTDSFNLQAGAEFNIEATAPLVITTANALSRGTEGVPYPSAIVVTGGTMPYTFTKSAGSLPTGLSLSAAGTISGTPTATGTFSFTISVSDASGRSASKSYSIAIVDPLAQTTTRLNDGISGQSYTQALAASGGYGAYTWSIYAGLLPDGLSLNPASAIISGNPLAAAQQMLVVAVMDADGRTSYKTFTLKISDPLAITTSSLPVGYLGNTYSANIPTSGGITPFSFSYTGTLPAGLSLEASTGTISGTPSAVGLTNLSLTVADSTYPTPVTVTRTISLRIWNALSITTTTIPDGTQKTAYSTNLSGSGGAQPLSWSIAAGSLPTGVTLDSAGTIAGTPASCGAFPFTARLTDSAAVPRSVDKPLTLNIACVPINASCGTANNGIFATTPANNLCTIGTASTATGTGPWNWTCAGEYGGTNASCSALPGVPLNLTFAGTGGGSVSGDMSCASGTACSSQAFTTGSTVNLLATPNAISTFFGWSGACTVSPCTFTMNAAKTVNATFNKAPKAMIDTTGYDSIAAAYADAASTATILALDSEMPDTGLTLNEVKSIIIKGGYKADYSDRSGLPTLLNGVLCITNGKLTVDNLVVK